MLALCCVDLEQTDSEGSGVGQKEGRPRNGSQGPADARKKPLKKTTK